MLLDEDPAIVMFSPRLASKTRTDSLLQLIQVTLENFNTQPDKIAIGRINESLLGLQQSRDLRLREAQGAVRSN